MRVMLCTPRLAPTATWAAHLQAGDWLPHVPGDWGGHANTQGPLWTQARHPVHIMRPPGCC